MLFGGVGILAYLAMVAFVPADDSERAWMDGRSRTSTIVLTALLAIAAVSTLSPPAFVLGPGLFVVAAVSVVGVVLYRAFGGARGDDPARAIARATLVLLVLVAAAGAATGVAFVAAIGGGPAIAVISIFGGLGLIAAGLLGGPRWLILPVTVLVLPLAVVSASDLDLRGGVGERAYRPASVSALQPEYRIGVGQLDVDLRDMTLPAGRTELKLRVGMGEAVVHVPDGVCVSTDGNIGMGAADVPERIGEGTDVDLEHRAPDAPGRPQVLVTADIGVGHLRIDQFDACA
jgi:hypothetical protein